VVGRDFDALQTNLVIDKGTAAGPAASACPVFSTAGLVGSLSQVFENTAWVTAALQQEPPGELHRQARSRVVGVLGVALPEFLRAQTRRAVEDVGRGDTLLTSGFGGHHSRRATPVAVVTRVVAGERRSQPAHRCAAVPSTSSHWKKCSS
jgi:cell shape-determining protein MreC